MMVLALITSVVLGGLALLHILWAFEIWWPIREERRLVSAVVGFGEATRMPGAIPCGMVTLALSLILVLVWIPEGLIRNLGLVVAAVVMALRGGMAYLPHWRKLTPQQPFARNDRLFYGPLCLVLALSLVVLRGWS